MDFNIDVLIVFAFIFFLASFIHGSIGFGFPMVATPLLAILTDIQTAIILTLIPTLLVNIVSIISEGRLLYAIRRYLSLALFAMGGSAIGTFILIITDSEIFELLLATAILVYLLLEKIKFNIFWIKAYPLFSKLFFGVLAGCLGGLTNVMAPVLIIYTLESKYSKSEIIQASNICFLLGKIIQLFLFSLHGKFNTNELTTSAIMLIVVSLALYLGVRIKKNIEVNSYKNVLRVFLFVLSVLLFIKVAI
ncbi:MAG: sulfite exporter TauE/SafE family protein [Gammaproteobacteria bacterium]|nr:sulfite exporter TauE/SafE family protein [Gammaproteobacteria bacterium]